MHRLFKINHAERVCRKAASSRQKKIERKIGSRPINRTSTINTSNIVTHESLKQIDQVDAINLKNISKNIFAPENVSFGNMTTYEMMRSILVLTICSLPRLAENAPKILEVARKYMGKKIFSKVMRMTFYGQFVSGNNLEEINQTITKLEQCDVLPMLAVTIEDQIAGSELIGDELYEHNTSKVLHCIDVASSTRRSDKPCMMQLKLTALFNFDLLEILSSKLKTNSQLTTTQLATGIENGAPKIELSEILPLLTKQQVTELASGLHRLLRIVNKANENDVTILTDAEYTWVNPAIHYISIGFMKAYNKTHARVYTTYQGYLKTLRFGRHPLCLCDNLEATNDNYNACVQDIFQMDEKKVQVMFATHNEDSVRLVADLLARRKRKESESATVSNIRFGQLYGMADYMSFTLSKMGYEVYKSLPYGSVEETMPYLCRRAKENTLFLSGVRKEMIMLRKGLAMKLGRSKNKNQYCTNDQNHTQHST
ncbi:hydroxyproline dehydrogenase-like [Styela clava]